MSIIEILGDHFRADLIASITVDGDDLVITSTVPGLSCFFECLDRFAAETAGRAVVGKWAKAIGAEIVL